MAAVSLVLLAGLFTFPPASLAPGSATLDGSWVAEINRLAETGKWFGRDVAFTYGPLGYLLYPMDCGNHLAWASFLRFAFAIGFAALAARRALRAPDVGAAAMFAFAQVAAVALGLAFEHQLLVPLPLAAASVLEAGSLLGAAGLAVLAGGLVFVKMSTAAGAAAVVATMLALWVLRAGPRRWTAVAVATVAFAATLAALAALLLRSAGDLGPWLRTSLAMASAYSEAMSWVGPDAEVTVAAAALVAWGALAVALAWRRTPAGPILLCSLGPAFLTFKHAFVRADAPHVRAFFPYLLATAGLVALETRPRLGRTAGAGATVAALTALSLWVASVHRPEAGAPAVPPLEIRRVVLGQAGVSALASWAWPPTLREHFGRKRVEHDFVPGLHEYAAGRTVGVVPWELGACIANDLNCAPNPTLQSFAAYTPELDRASAERYTGAGAPDLVLAHFDAIDGRNIALDTPYLWRALSRGYAPAPQSPPQFLLLARRSEPLPRRERTLPIMLAPARTWIPVPPAVGRRSVRIAFDPTPWGRLARAAFRVPPVTLVVRRQSRRVEPWRIVPATARDGLPLDDLPFDVASFVAVLSGERLSDPVMAIWLDGAGLDYFRQPVPLTWVEEEDAPPPSKAGSPAAR